MLGERPSSAEAAAPACRPTPSSRTPWPPSRPRPSRRPRARRGARLATRRRPGTPALAAGAPRRRRGRRPHAIPDELATRIRVRFGTGRRRRGRPAGPAAPAARPTSRAPSPCSAGTSPCGAPGTQPGSSKSGRPGSPERACAPRGWRRVPGRRRRPPSCAPLFVASALGCTLPGRRAQHLLPHAGCRHASQGAGRPRRPSRAPPAAHPGLQVVTRPVAGLGLAAERGVQAPRPRRGGRFLAPGARPAAGRPRSRGESLRGERLGLALAGPGPAGRRCTCSTRAPSTLRNLEPRSAAGRGSRCSSGRGARPGRGPGARRDASCAPRSPAAGRRVGRPARPGRGRAGLHQLPGAPGP